MPVANGFLPISSHSSKFRENKVRLKSFYERYFERKRRRKSFNMHEIPSPLQNTADKSVRDRLEGGGFRHCQTLQMYKNKMFLAKNKLGWCRKHAWTKENQKKNILIRKSCDRGQSVAQLCSHIISKSETAKIFEERRQRCTRKTWRKMITWRWNKKTGSLARSTGANIPIANRIVDIRDNHEFQPMISAENARKIFPALKPKEPAFRSSISRKDLKIAANVDSTIFPLK